MPDAPSVLHLTLLRRWFDEIAIGKKKKEYRERKKHWQMRNSKAVSMT